jgi:hypothetical protein
MTPPATLPQTASARRLPGLPRPTLAPRLAAPTRSGAQPSVPAMITKDFYCYRRKILRQEKTLRDHALINRITARGVAAAARTEA